MLRVYIKTKYLQCIFYNVCLITSNILLAWIIHRVNAVLVYDLIVWLRLISIYFLPKNTYLLPTDMHTDWWVLGGKKMLVFRRNCLGYWIDDPSFTSNSADNIFLYSLHIRKNNDQVKLKIVKSIRYDKIGSSFMIYYVFCFKDYHL